MFHFLLGSAEAEWARALQQQVQQQMRALKQPFHKKLLIVYSAACYGYGMRSCFRFLEDAILVGLLWEGVSRNLQYCGSSPSW